MPADSSTPSPATDVLVREAVRLAQHADDKWDALRQSGALLEGLGAVDEGYAAAILEREGQISTYMGEGVAIPHGTDAARALVRRTALGSPSTPTGSTGMAKPSTCASRSRPAATNKWASSRRSQRFLSMT